MRFFMTAFSQTPPHAVRIAIAALCALTLLAPASAWAAPDATDAEAPPSEVITGTAPAQPAPWLPAGWSLTDDDAWHYGNADGTSRVGWLWDRGSWYYLDPTRDGAMATGWAQVDGTWYYLSGSGAMLTGWQQLGGTWYYLDSSGAMAEGWQYLGDSWYYLWPDSGAMATGWAQVDGTWYYLSGSGAMLTGWQQLGGTWYYLDSSGAMAEGWQYLGGCWYYLWPDSGAMATGWIDLDGTWYYLKGSGTMVANQWVGDYYLMGDGAMATNRWIGEYYVGNDGLWNSAGPGYSSAARFLNIQWAGQPNSYYCGPTSGYMVLHHLGAFGAADGTPLTINNVARFMGATPAGVFLETRDFERGINRWLGWNAYYTIPHPSYETVRDAVLRSFDTGYPVVVHTWEGNGRYYNGHRNSMGHLMVVDGYDPETDAIYLVDPWAGVSGASAQKFWYGGLREFTNTFINPYRGIYTH